MKNAWIRNRRMRRIILFFTCMTIVFGLEHLFGEAIASATAITIGLFHGTDVADTIMK